jgi:hypothetical protein
MSWQEVIKDFEWSGSKEAVRVLSGRVIANDFFCPNWKPYGMRVLKTGPLGEEPTLDVGSQLLER